MPLGLTYLDHLQGRPFERPLEEPGAQVPLEVFGRGGVCRDPERARLSYSPTRQELRASRSRSSFNPLRPYATKNRAGSAHKAFSKCLAVLLTAQAKGSLPAMSSWETATLRPVRMPQR